MTIAVIVFKVPHTWEGPYVRAEGAFLRAIVISLIAANINGEHTAYQV